MTVRRAARAAAVAAVALTGVVASGRTVAATDDAPPIDPALAAAVDDAATGRTRVPVEILTLDTDAAVRDVRRSGGIVVGTVAGEIVQASVPAARVDQIDPSGATYLRLPRRVNRPRAGAIDLGPVVGQNVPVMNVSAWHAAGVRGAVKVGIVDFFDLGLWNTTEHGARPDPGHVFCLDTSGEIPNYCPMAEDGANNGDGEEHGVAVAEVLKDVAPDAELYLATVGTTSDLRAAIDWFAAQGVTIISRSLGAPYDGPGDGTGPLAAVVDHAASLGITWFNSAGNDASGSYGRFTGGVAADGYVDFDNGPGVDTTLTLHGMCIGFDGIRWNDWGKAASGVTDYRVEVTVPGVGSQPVVQTSQIAGAPPLELVDEYICTLSGQISLRMRRVASGGDTSADIIEIGLFSGRFENGRSQPAFSASKPVVDSRNPALVSVGAVDPPGGNTVASYSSRGPTNDGRVKPDVVAPSCVSSTIYNAAVYGPGACFNGTSASAPSAAGAAALLQSRRLATGGASLGALVRHLAVDIGDTGPDLAAGFGTLRLPTPPQPGVDSRPARYEPLGTAQRLLDTRAESVTPGARIGPFPPHTILDLPLTQLGPDVTAVAIAVVSIDSVAASYVQALPTFLGELGGFANLNVATPGQIKPNFAVVPRGIGGSISVYLPTGGNVVVDLMGTFVAAADGTATSGRFVPVDPLRVLDTRPTSFGPLPPGWTPHTPFAGEEVRVTGLPVGASAVVVNITATEAAGPGWLRAQPFASPGSMTANGNFVPGVSSGMVSIVPVAADGTIGIYLSAATHVVADLLGWFTGAGAPAGSDGLFVPITPGRSYDSRWSGAAHAASSTTTIQLAGTPLVPAGAIAVSANVASDGAAADGFLTLSPTGAPRPLVSNLNFPPSSPISNAALSRVAGAGNVDAYVNRSTHVIIDVNGYFTGPMPA